MPENSNNHSRRNFVIRFAAVSTALIVHPIFGYSTNQRKANSSESIAKAFGIDAHNHMDVTLTDSELSSLDINLREAMKKSGLSAICMTFMVDRPQLTEPGQAYERFLNGLDKMDAILNQNQMTMSLNMADLKKANKEEQPTVILTVEGGHFIEGQLERLHLAYDRGLRQLGLLHDEPSFVPLGDIYTKPAVHNGLTNIGKKVISACNQLGILVDLTHCSNKAIDDALEISEQPMIISHTGLDSQLGSDPKIANMMKPRLISKKQAKIMADAGGVIGVWTHLSDAPMEYAANIRAMVDVVGIDHVCIGTDTKMAAPQESQQRPGSITNKAWKEQEKGFYFTIIDALSNTGFSQNEIEKIGSGNYLRVFESATKK